MVDVHFDKTKCAFIEGKTPDDCPGCEYFEPVPVMPGAGFCRYLERHRNKAGGEKKNVG